MRELVTLSCSGCKRRNYATSKNTKTTRAKLSLRKYCKWCRQHTEHKEV